MLNSGELEHKIKIKKEKDGTDCPSTAFQSQPKP